MLSDLFYFDFLQNAFFSRDIDRTCLPHHWRFSRS